MRSKEFGVIRNLIEFGDGLSPIQLLILDDLITQSKNRYKRTMIKNDN